jgi:hypothetical protein
MATLTDAQYTCLEHMLDTGADMAYLVRDELWDTADAISTEPGIYGTKEARWDEQMGRVRSQEALADELRMLARWVR